MSGKINMNGKWEFELDPKNRGRSEEWWRRRSLGSAVRVPGAWQAQGHGGDLKHTIAQLGHPALRIERHGYKGTGWYRKAFNIPRKWSGRRIWLTFGGVHPRGEFWLNGSYLGKDPGGFLEFKFDITDKVRFDRKNDVSARVYENSRMWDTAFEGSIYNFITLWSGLYREVSLSETGEAWIESISVFPCLKNKKVRVVLELGCARLQCAKAEMIVEIRDPNGRNAGAARRSINLNDAELSVDIVLGDVFPWSLESPQLYTVKVKLIDGQSLMDEKSERFGLRDISVRGRKITLNKCPLYLRGFGDSMIFPRTLSPDLDKEFIRRFLQAARSYGFNAITCYCVPYREFLEVADEVGMLLQIFPGDNAGTALSRRMHLAKLMRQTINHPSIMCYGWSAERYQNTPEHVRNLDRLYEFSKQIDPTRLSLARDGEFLPSWPGREGNIGFGKTDFEILVANDRGFYTEKMLKEEVRKPVLMHEAGWFSSYPNPAMKRKYRNLPLLPFHITFAEKVARLQGVSDILPVFVKNSEILQAMERKQALEAFRKVPSISGFFLWMGRDSASSVEGIWDDFGNPKNVSADDCRKYNGDTVLLMNQDFRGISSRTESPAPRARAKNHLISDWQGRNIWEGEKLKVDILVSHYGEKPVTDAELRWFLTARPSGKKLDGGKVKGLRAPRFTTKKLVRLSAQIPALKRASRMELGVELREERLIACNSWDFWGFPKGFCLKKNDMHGVWLYAKPSKLEFGMDQESAAVKNEPYFSQSLPRIHFGGHHSQSVVGNTCSDGRHDYGTFQASGLTTSPRLIISLNQLSNGLIDYLEAGGNVWLLSENVFPEYLHYFRSIRWHAVPWGNSGTVVCGHPCLARFPHEGFCDLQMYDLTRGACTVEDHQSNSGAVNLDIWPGRIQPIIRSIDSYMGARLRGLLFEARVGAGRLMVSRLNFYDTPASRVMASEIARYMQKPDCKCPNVVPSKFLRHFVNQRG